MSESAIDQPERTVLPSAPSTFEREVLAAAKGGGVTFIGKMVTLATRFAIAFILARLLGASGYGLYNLSVSMLWLASGLALVGLDIAMVRYVAVFSARRDEAGLWGALQMGLGITTLLSVLIGIALYFLAYPIAVQRFHEPTLAPLLRLVSLFVPFLTLSTVAGAATQGFKKMQYAAISRDIVQPLIRLLLVVGLALLAELNAAGALLILGLAVAVAAVMLLYFLNKLFQLKRPLGAARRDTGEIMRFSLSVYMTDLMTLFQENVQTLLLGALNTVINVGRFAVANQINLIGNMFQASITTAVRPIIAQLHDQGERAQMGRIYQTATKWMITVNLPLFLIVVLFPQPILSIFGRSFVNASTALVILATANMIDIGTGMCGAVIDMTGYTVLKLVNAIVQLLLSLGLSILLIPTWGIVGAAAAVLIGLSAINILRLLEVFVLFRLLPYNLSIIKPVIAGCAGLATALGVDSLLPAGVLHIDAIVSGSMLVVVYTAVILLLGLSPEDRLVLARLRRRMISRLPRR